MSGSGGRLAATGKLLREVRDYLGLRRSRRRRPIVDPAGLQAFLETRASHVAQTALYGYLRTRAGTRYPELFENDRFVESINIAKWQVWLACVSDLSVYAGGLVARRSEATSRTVDGLMRRSLESVLEDTGHPEDAGPDYGKGASRVLARIDGLDWAAVEDDESCFSESPAALIEWAPIVEDLKRLDDEIVRNSVRFRWHEVRRELRRLLDADTLVRAAREAAGTAETAGTAGAAGTGGLDESRQG